ncbi:MAG TPA: hypothetical protein VGB92_10365 [Longimicrobium sp.]|jgi:hypothetical protein
MPANYSEDDEQAASVMVEDLLEQVRSSQKAWDAATFDPPTGTFVSLEASEIFTADVESALDRFALQYALFHELDLPFPGIMAGGMPVPVDVLSSPVWLEPLLLYGWGAKAFDRILQYNRRPGFPSSEFTPISPDVALETLSSRLREFLAIRFSARESNISQKPGLQFEVATTTPGLRVHYSPAYFINLNTVFSSPTSPVKQWIQPGRYIFGAVGRYTPLQFDFVSHYSIPFDTLATLAI